MKDSWERSVYIATLTIDRIKKELKECAALSSRKEEVEKLPQSLEGTGQDLRRKKTPKDYKTIRGKTSDTKENTIKEERRQPLKISLDTDKNLRELKRLEETMENMVKDKQKERLKISVDTEETLRQLKTLQEELLKKEKRVEKDQDESALLTSAKEEEMSKKNEKNLRAKSSNDRGEMIHKID
ncbi:MAG: hypothetical protein DSY42_08620 [Aquifex sp.]|nr:MAG: hypothetical protein DSY42_08620 [Aquifex sp.]